MNALTTAGALLVGFEIAVLGYFVVTNLWHLALMVGATLEMRDLATLGRDGVGSRLLASPLAPSITVLTPLQHGADTGQDIERVSAVLAQHYPNLEIVVVDDRGDPIALRILRDHFHLVAVHPIYRRSIVTTHVRGLYRSAVYPNLVVIDKAPAGEADALNAALNVATGDLVCSVRDDVLLERDALQRLVVPFLEDNGVLATGGSVRIANGAVVRGGRVVEARVPRQPLAAMQVTDHIRTFVSGRLGWNRIGGNLMMSGAFGLYRRDAVIDAGGYRGDDSADEVELVLRLRRRGHERGGPRRVAFVPDPVAWANAPTTTTALGTQRGRWQRALTEATRRHRSIVLDPRYGVLGLVVMPYVLLFEVLAPVIELLGVLGLALGLATGVLDPAFAALFLLVAYGLSAVLTVCTLVMDELLFERSPRLSDRLRLVGQALIEPFGYRQLTVFWRLQGLERYLRSRSRASGEDEYVPAAPEQPARRSA